MEFLFVHLPAPFWPLGMFLAGAVAGSLLERGGRCLLHPNRPLLPRCCEHCGVTLKAIQRIPAAGQLPTLGRCRGCGRPTAAWSNVASAGTGLLFAAFLISYVQFGCQQTVEVRPSPIWNDLRLLFHLVLFSLLVVLITTDLQECVIPGEVTALGAFFALSAATLSGQLQLAHLWVDWNVPDAQIHGQYIPEWIRRHLHLHGLAWSAGGLLAGGALTWLARALASTVLGAEALGFGDVLLMAMIGSFIGWQPVIVVFLLAPFCGLLVGLLIRLLSNKPYVPYGPFLGAATVLVLFTWKWIWQWEPLPRLAARHIFGDAPGLAILAAIATVAFALMLVLVRGYRMIPGKRR